MERKNPKTGAKPKIPRNRNSGRNKKTVKAARGRLKNFRKASVLAVSITGILLILFAYTGSEAVSEADTSFFLSSENNSYQSDNAPEQDIIATEEAIGALQNLLDKFIFSAPKLLIALTFIILSWLVIWFIRYVLRKGLQKIRSSKGIISLISIALWILVVGVVFSIIAGDMRALLGSIGLVGLALSWALQTPIESLMGWLLNAFNHYYRIGDRIRVGDIFGDVYKIDYLTTTIWEIGSPFQAGIVNAEQPTGRLVTFPNNEVLTGSVVNLTADFPYVWDELVISITNESDIKHAIRVLEEASANLIGEYMKQPILQYKNILQKASLPADLPDTPKVFISPVDSWIDVSIRYLVGARERRQWKTKLFLHINEVLEQEENRKRISHFYPRHQLQFITEQGNPEI